MKFWEASAVVPLAVAEPSTRAMQAVVRKDPVMRICWATAVECASALARLERAGLLGEAARSIA